MKFTSHKKINIQKFTKKKKHYERDQTLNQNKKEKKRHIQKKPTWNSGGGSMAVTITLAGPFFTVLKKSPHIRSEVSVDSQSDSDRSSKSLSCNCTLKGSGVYIYTYLHTYIHTQTYIEIHTNTYIHTQYLYGSTVLLYRVYYQKQTKTWRFE